MGYEFQNRETWTHENKTGTIQYLYKVAKKVLKLLRKKLFLISVKMRKIIFKKS